MIGFIYIVALPQFIESNESIFKIGRSCNVSNRLQNYPKNTIVYFHILCDDLINCEKEVIKILTEKFKRRTEFGREYFEGPYSEIQKTVAEICISSRYAVAGHPSSVKNITDIITTNDDKAAISIVHRCKSDLFLCFTTLIANMFNNDKFPSNMCIKVQNKKDIYVFENDNWVPKNQTDIAKLVFEHLLNDVIYQSRTNQNLLANIEDFVSKCYDNYNTCEQVIIHYICHSL